MKLPPIHCKTSNASGGCEPFRDPVESGIPRSEAPRRSPDAHSAWEHALKSHLPKPEASASLHASIMRAVRASKRPAPAENRPAWPRWVPVPSLALLAILGVWLVVQSSTHPVARVQPANARTLASTSSTLELGGSLMSQAPAAAMSPLNDEMERLGRDLADAKKFILSSVP
jgi:hypothetical protein